MASLMIEIMLFTAMGAALGGTGIEALFFARFGVEYLPYMFVGLGITSMILSFGFSAALGSLPRRVLYVSIPLFITFVLILARLVLLTKLSWLYPALWIGKEILNFLTGILIWGIAGVVCDTRQAKRLFPLFNASRILGQVIGGFVTGLLVNAIGIENLLLVWAGTMLLSFLLSRSLLREQHLPSLPAASPRQKQSTLIHEMQQGYRYVRKSRLMRWISLSAILFSILYFSISLPFSRAATEHYVDEENLAAFLGLFNGVSTAAAFLASLFLANRLFARFGVMFCILVFTVIYLVGFAGLALFPVFIIIVSFRFVQMLWLSGIADPAYQAMFNVVPGERRDQVRTFIDGVPEQAGVFIAGAVLIIGEQTLAPQQLYIVGLIAAALCTFAIYRARGGYNEALVEALQAGNPHLFYSEEQPFGGFRQDAAAVRAVVNGLKDANPVVRRISARFLGTSLCQKPSRPFSTGWAIRMRSYAPRACGPWLIQNRIWLWRGSRRYCRIPNLTSVLRRSQPLRLCPILPLNLRHIFIPCWRMSTRGSAPARPLPCWKLAVTWKGQNHFYATQPRWETCLTAKTQFSPWENGGIPRPSIFWSTN